MPNCRAHFPLSLSGNNGCKWSNCGISKACGTAGTKKRSLFGLEVVRHMVLSWFASRVNPIAVDIGTDTIKLLQVEPEDGQHRLSDVDNGKGAGHESKN